MDNADPQQQNNNSGPDAQIRAHRKQHQSKLNKLLLLAVVFCVAIGLIVGVSLYLKRAPDTNDDPAPNEQLESYSEAQLKKYRDDFQQALSEYEEQLQPQINQVLLADFETEKASALALQKQKMLSAFANGSFVQAKQQLDALVQNADNLVQQWRQQANSHVETALQAFEQGQIPQAQINVNKALELMPTNTSALNLQIRINAYSEVNKFLDELDVAVIENNLNKQVTLLKRIVELDPQRSDVAKELSEAQAALAKQTLANYLNQAESALQNGQISQAQQFVNKAKAINAKEKGVLSLQKRINTALANNKLGAAKLQLADLASADKWQQVDEVASDFLQQYPSDSDLQDFKQQAQQVILAKRSLALFVSKPERLADENIRAAATKALQNALVPSLKSPSLQEMLAAVSTSIDQYSEPVAITVNSDGKTYIIVVGVGHVGQHKQKTIQLTPGEYVLQGRRDGYKNKRQSFTVVAGKALNISLVCDEKL